MGRMTETGGFAERRQHKRFRVHEGAFAILRPRYDILGQVIDIVGQIVNVSRGGLMFRYITSEYHSHEPFQLDIVVAGDDFRLDGIPFKTASDTDMGDPLSLSSVAMRRQGVQFGALTDDQGVQLEYFIGNYATRMARPDYSVSINKGQGHSLPCR